MCARCPRASRTIVRSRAISRPWRAPSPTALSSRQSRPRSESSRETAPTQVGRPGRTFDPEASVPRYGARLRRDGDRGRFDRVGNRGRRPEGIPDRRPLLRRRNAVDVAELAEPAARRRSGRKAVTTVGVESTVEALCGDLSSIRAPRGSDLHARSWATEAPLRMLLNNLDREVAEHPEELIVYGGSGKAARNHDALKAIVRALLVLEEDETLLVQSGKPVGV